MPELPEVEIVRRGLEPAMLDQTINHVRINRKDLRLPIPANFQSVVEGDRITALKRRGKYILAFLENGRGFVLHLGMSGRVHIYKPEDTYKPAKHDHVVFETGRGKKIVFNDPRRFGMLYLTDQDWQKEKPFSVMGPEPLSNDFSGPVLAGALEGRKASIKAALLDQAVVAGIGNIYACEALYHAGIGPQRAASTINMRESEKLAAAIREVLNKALAAGGSSLKDYQHTDGTLGYFQTSFSVYDREGEFCPACKNGDSGKGCVKRIVQAGRSSFYCSKTQK